MNTTYRVNHKYNGNVISYGIFKDLQSARASIESLRKRANMIGSAWQYELEIRIK